MRISDWSSDVCSSDLHRLIAAAQGVVDRPLEVGLQQPVFLPRRELVVGSEAAEVEERRVEAGIVTVDQPEPLAIVEIVGRQQVFVDEDKFNRTDCMFPIPGKGRPTRHTEGTGEVCYL